MSRYLASRLVQIAIALAIMSLVVYLLIGLMPGDPIDMMISGNPKMTSEDAKRLRALYGIDKPLLERYLAWAHTALSGDLGYSTLYKTAVNDIIHLVAELVENAAVFSPPRVGIVMNVTAPPLTPCICWDW